MARTVREYGGQGTIHQTSDLGVEVDKDGQVVAVWFRCLSLPFHQVVVDEQRAHELRDNAPGISIQKITYESES